VCPPPSGVVSARPEDEQFDYAAFLAESGSVSKMAIVRRRAPRVLGRYLLGDAIAAGGMATVHLGRLVGPAGFSRTVAVKRLHAHLATNPEFVQRFVDEARIASRVRHTNVVQTLDVIASDGELLLVLDYVHGESLARLRRFASARGMTIPPNVASGIVSAVLRGLHAAHEAKSAKGAPLDLVHRDVTPQNILVGADGVARVLDFGIAKATGLTQESISRDVKGKLAYMPPEQVSRGTLDRRSDLFAVGVVLWEALAGERLFRSDDIASTIDAIYNREAPRLSERGLGISPAVDDVLARALAKAPAQRYETADAMARAVEAALLPASDREIAEWVAAVGHEALAERLASVESFERDDTGQSKARLFAAAPLFESETTHRDALMPPPLAAPADDSEAVTPQRNPRFATIASGNTAAMPTPLPLPAGASEIHAVLTPLGFVAPIVAPVERRAQAWTPMPMAIPIPMPAAAPKRRGPSPIQLGILVGAVALLVMAGVVGTRPLRASASEAPPSTSVEPVATIEPTLVVAPVAPPSAPIEGTDAGVGVLPSAPTSAPPAATVRRGARPVPHRPRPARSGPVAANH
jgi:eukaryotic-like serine/threonine-protein kinase